ncbi:MAG TPA: MXAN_2562 family outer membrane beta-barrel protein, partial [Myxococcaceae bacterium]|nr:MXAN_2562 family outer membrane beta-barrel protein [Myxococcaceae bacterium]
AAVPAQAQEAPVTESPRTSFLEIKFGSFRPRIDREFGDGPGPYAQFFGDRSMLMAEIEYDRQFFQAFGSAALGLSVAYAEVYAPTTFASSGEASGERAGFRVIPLKLLAVYRFDVLAQRARIPLVPYAKASLQYVPWKAMKATGTECSGDVCGSGARWGYGGALGVALQLDFLDGRMARDFDAGVGVNHSYFFAEYNASQVTNFGDPGLNLSGRYWLFGLGLEF